MNFFSILDKLNTKQTSLILFSLLDRIPIFVLGDEPDKIDNLLLDLSELIE